jgi:lipid-A-disaccharide synthase-like uncharacterized protein
MSTLLTPEERRLVFLYLKPGARAPERRLWYVAFILPSLLFAIYSLWNRDFVAALVAYVALLAVALMYLSYSSRQSEHLRSALEKYEAAIGALKDSVQ